MTNNHYITIWTHHYQPLLLVAVRVLRVELAPACRFACASRHQPAARLVKMQDRCGDFPVDMWGRYQGLINVEEWWETMENLVKT